MENGFPGNANIDLVRDWVEQVWNGADLALLAEFHSASFQNEGSNSNINQAREWHQDMHSVFPDLKYVIEDLVAAGDRVAFRWTAAGTHKGMLWGFIHPTGRKISWNGMHMLQIKDRRIVEIWAISNTTAQLQQMGIQLLQPHEMGKD